MEEFRNFISAGFNPRSTLFWLHQRRQLARFKDFFDEIEANPLTDLQRRAVVLNERRNLVVAGAGTGKTSVIIAKVGYLVESGFCEPDEILLLAFNRKAADELAERCRSRLGIAVQAETFHSLGNKILGTCLPRVPAVSEVATDTRKFAALINDLVDELFRSKRLREDLLEFFTKQLKPWRDEHEFNDLSEYSAYVRNVELRALSGDQVRSFAELAIANFLFLQGVKFQYEARYPHTHFRYQPDFYLPSIDAYIEHFGIDRKNNTAPYIDRERYLAEMERKRCIHAEHGTTLIETFGWQHTEGRLIDLLEQRLSEEGIQYAPVPDEEIIKRLREMGYFSQFAKIVSTSMAHVRSNRTPVSKLRSRARQSGQGRRATLFVEVFSWILDRYEQMLEAREEIDFDDMIGQARELVEDRSFRLPWKCIIVDEFQDISSARYLLLKSMLRARRDAHLFVVGDDWQSINRFAGSDISIMSHFRNHFGRATIVKLDRTFRFDDSLAVISGRFIQENPTQIRKTLKANAVASEPAVTLHWSRMRPEQALVAAVRYISDAHDVSNAALLILGRYNRSLPGRTELRKLERAWTGSSLNSSTIHSAKGVEADYVIITDLRAGSYGIPSEIEDDPLINLVLSEEEDFPHAEERRVFYVALTRARIATHLLVNLSEPSAFARELGDGEYEVINVGMTPFVQDRCPACDSGVIVERQTGFHSCSNFPFCDYRPARCNRCEVGYMPSRKGGNQTCSNESCDAVSHPCPKCRIGTLTARKGRYGEFYGCHTWPVCDFTSKAV